MRRPRLSILRKQSANGQAAEPIAGSELDSLFAVYSGFETIALAISGGPDSLALLHLSLDWRARLPGRGPQFIVLAVDHGLRPEAAAEAANVAQGAVALGLQARVLTRDAPASPTALQAAARSDRYRLLAAAAREAGAQALATGHTLDDQAETLLMRLARGSGVDGLSAMSPISRPGDLTLLRPLLSLTKLRLEASLRARDISWVVDPSNANPAFERPRLRALAPALAAAGLSAGAIATSARRLARGRAALEQVTNDAALRLVTIHGAGFFEIDRVGFEALPEEIRLRLLGHLISRIGTPDQPERLARLERLVAQLSLGPAPAASLAGCLVSASALAIGVLREPGRDGLPELQLRPGDCLAWDRRFDVSLVPQAASGVLVRALQASDLRGESATAARASGLPRAALMALPSAWRGDVLIAAPLPGLTSPEVTFATTLAHPWGRSVGANDVATQADQDV